MRMRDWVVILGVCLPFCVGMFSGYYSAHASLWTNWNPDTVIHSGAFLLTSAYVGDMLKAYKERRKAVHNA
jgi:hypothetical protein